MKKVVFGITLCLGVLTSSFFIGGSDNSINSKSNISLSDLISLQSALGQESGCGGLNWSYTTYDGGCWSYYAWDNCGSYADWGC